MPYIGEPIPLLLRRDLSTLQNGLDLIGVGDDLKRVVIGGVPIARPYDPPALGLCSPS